MSYRCWAPRRSAALAGMLLILSLFFGAPLSWAAEPYSIEAVTLQSSASLPKSLVANLDPRGSRIFTYIDGLKVSVCEVYLATSVSLQGEHSKSSHPPYANLNPGTLIGVVRFLSEAGEEYREDVHDQKLKPGYYTMRYAMLPGGEAGDFLMLSPVRVDQDPTAVLPIDQLIRQGQSASGTDQAAVLRLVPAEEGHKEAVSVRMDNAGTCILQARVHAKPSTGAAHDLDLAMILVNPIPEGEGS